MRRAWLVLIALAGTAHADRKLQGFKPEYVREVAGCQVQVSGLAKVLAGASELAKTGETAERAELERDVDQLAKGHALAKEHCDEVASMIAFIDANAAAPYRSIERELDARYKKIVQLRAASRKTIAELQPTMRKLIPRTAAHPQAAPAQPKRVPGKFPSGRTVDLPSLGGTWRLGGSNTTDTADYTEPSSKGKTAVAASATTRPFSGTTCDDQRKALLLRSDAEELDHLDLPGAKELGVAWGMRYTRREPATAHLVSVLCVPGKTGGLLATADVAPPERAALVDELASLLLRMIATQKPQ